MGAKRGGGRKAASWLVTVAAWGRSYKGLAAWGRSYEGVAAWGRSYKGVADCGRSYKGLAAWGRSYKGSRRGTLLQASDRIVLL